MKSKCRTALVVLSAAVALTALSAAPAFASGPPSTETKPATPIGETTATLNGIVNPNGAETKYYFEYGKTNAYGTKTAEVSAGSGATNIEESQALTGLSTDTIYYFRVAAKNANGTTRGAEGIFTTTSKPGLPEFVPKAGSKGETFPLAIEAKTGQVNFEAAEFGNPVWCSKMTLSGSITAAKTVSLTYSFEGCKESTGERDPCNNFVMSGTGSLVYLNKATKQVGLLLPVGRHAIICQSGADEEKYNGTLISPITPINTETTKPEMRYHAYSHTKEEFTEYENDKSEKILTKFEWNTTDSFWEAASLEIGTIFLTTPRGLTIKA